MNKNNQLGLAIAFVSAVTLLTMFQNCSGNGFDAIKTSVSLKNGNVVVNNVPTSADGLGSPVNNATDPNNGSTGTPAASGSPASNPVTSASPSSTTASSPSPASSSNKTIKVGVLLNSSDKNSVFATDYVNAKSACAAAVINGENGYRLPSDNELEAVYLNRAKIFSYYFDANHIPNAGVFWSAVTQEYSPGIPGAHIKDFSDGKEGVAGFWNWQQDSTAGVICVK